MVLKHIPFYRCQTSLGISHQCPRHSARASAKVRPGWSCARGDGAFALRAARRSGTTARAREWPVPVLDIPGLDARSGSRGPPLRPILQRVAGRGSTLFWRSKIRQKRLLTVEGSALGGAVVKEKSGNTLPSHLPNRLDLVERPAQCRPPAFSS